MHSKNNRLNHDFQIAYCGLLACLVITRWWKVSVHATVAGGAVAAVLATGVGIGVGRLNRSAPEWSARAPTWAMCRTLSR